MLHYFEEMSYLRFGGKNEKFLPTSKYFLPQKSFCHYLENIHFLEFSKKKTTQNLIILNVREKSFFKKWRG